MNIQDAFKILNDAAPDCRIDIDVELIRLPHRQPTVEYTVCVWVDGEMCQQWSPRLEDAVRGVLLKIHPAEPQTADLADVDDQLVALAE